jgi:hypothetical protein
MSPEDSKKIFVVKLFVENGVDYLEFNFEQNVHRLNLNLDDNQADIKKMFCDLIPHLESNEIELKLQVDESYDNTLLKEVSNSYINDLNNELGNVRTEIQDRKVTSLEE